jgi:hypothetical protein
MKEAHRQQRQTLDGNQSKRAAQEEQARAGRLRKGIMGLWDRLSGKRGKVSEQNAREMAAGRVRDRAEKQTMIEAQLRERGELQGRIIRLRDDHRADRKKDRGLTAMALSMLNDENRADFLNTVQAYDRKKNPPTAAQTRRDRAEKRGTMPEIVASERTRRAEARRDKEAENSPVEGRDAGTGETAPEKEQAAHAQPEEAAGQDLEQGQQPVAGPASTGERLTQVWTKEQRDAAIERERQRQEQQRADRSNDNEDTGRTFDP